MLSYSPLEVQMFYLPNLNASKADILFFLGLDTSSRASPNFPAGKLELLSI